jgi:leucyl aminopeptidase
MTPTFAPDSDAAIPLIAVAPDSVDAALADLPAPARAWAQAQGFTGAAGQAIALPGPDGAVTHALIGLGDAKARARGRFLVAEAARKLPKGDYRLNGLDGDDLTEAALGWLLHSYDFARYRAEKPAPARLVAPEGVNLERLKAVVAGECLTRDLINTPSSDMGPDELEQAARDLAKMHKAKVKVILGQDLLAQNFPLIHTVGRASVRAPRLIELSWGTRGPQLTMVGKGVCFDTGGLDIKPASGMGLMKKDMGGAATVLGLAHMIMATGMAVRLRVLIPAVENSIDGNAFRPQDVLTARNGLTVEINNTDAEGRLVLADALALGSESTPDLMVSMATLTGAARVAVGPDLAPYYTDDDAHAAALTAGAISARDPVWRMPFHDPYEALIEPAIADLDNAPSGGFAGSITAALFLRRFATVPYMHFDIYGWQPVAAPGRPKGGVGQGARALFDALPTMLGL